MCEYILLLTDQLAWYITSSNRLANKWHPQSKQTASVVLHYFKQTGQYVFCC